MKKLTLACCAIVALASGAFAGTEVYSSNKSTVQSPCPSWYADNEWNIGVSGIYAPTTNSWADDRFIGKDHAWGGALDIKYFFRRYFGVGLQGFGLAREIRDDNNFFGDDSGNFVGGLLGTFTFRYPIPCSRLAPYAWVGVGAVFGDAVRHEFVATRAGNLLVPVRGDDDSRLAGQYGVGLEYRFTPHVGATMDVSYNEVDASDNDFWQFRGGVNFAF